MRFPVKLLCQSLGLSSALLVMNYGDLLGGGGDVRMHVPLPINGIVTAQIADIVLLGLVVFGLFLIQQSEKVQSFANLALAIVLPPYVIKRTQALYPFVIRHHFLVPFAIAWLIAVVLLFYKFPRMYQRLLQAGDAAGVCLAIFAFASIAQLLWIVRWKPGQQQHTAAWALSSPPPRQHPLLVWIVFDELSYDQTFEHRAPGLSLPAFDALKAQSTVFTNVQPAGIKTVEVVPSLLGGAVVNDVRFTQGNHLMVHDALSSKWNSFDGDDTIFHTAQQAGWRTAAVGWYNPYCTVYKEAIDSCYWNNLDQTDGPMSLQRGLWENTATPLKLLLEQIVAPKKAASDACTYDVQLRYRTHVDLRQHAIQLLQNDQADFVFLHLPIPHSPSIWNRAANTYRLECGGSYIDNLALADRTLGEFLQMLQSSPRWKETTVVVEGDHSWRVHLWDWLPTWTDEDREASRGVFDTRPALLVHEADQRQGQTNNSAWPLIKIHNVIGHVLRSEPSGF